MFGQYKRLSNQFVGVLTGKAVQFGGSLIRSEATGYGTVYMLEDMLTHRGDKIADKTALVSGSGNVAQYAAEKLIQLGAKVLTLSDSSGFVYDPDGLTREKLEFVKELKEVRRGRISEYAKEFGVEFHEGKRPWGVPADLALPCATQNEITGDDARTLIQNGCIGVSEGANMPSVKEAADAFVEANLAYAPSKAANAGGVAVSGLEMTQNSMRLSWTRDELDQRLRSIMRSIHDQCVQYGTEGSHVNYVKGANIAGFVKVAEAMISCGVV